MSKSNTWVILLRGINVGGVKVLMADLKQMLESLGMTDVKTLLASGNVVADWDEDIAADAVVVKQKVEAALAKTYGRPLAVIVRPLAAIQQMVADAPFAGIDVTKTTRLNVTFLGETAKPGFALPYESEGGLLQILANRGDALFSVLDLNRIGTVDAMAIIEKAWGKDVTTRSWNTVEKIAALR